MTDAEIAWKYHTHMWVGCFIADRPSLRLSECIKGTCVRVRMCVNLDLKFHVACPNRPWQLSEIKRNRLWPKSVFFSRFISVSHGWSKFPKWVDISRLSFWKIRMDGWTARVVYELEFGFNEWVSAVTQIHHTTYTHTRAHTQMHIENHINKENTGADTQHTDFEWHLHNYQLQANEIASYVFASIFIFFRLSCQLSKSILLCALRVDEFFSIHSKIKSFAFSLCSAPAQTNAVSVVGFL